MMVVVVVEANLLAAYPALIIEQTSVLYHRQHHQSFIVSALTMSEGGRIDLYSLTVCCSLVEWDQGYWIIISLHNAMY